MRNDCETKVYENHAQDSRIRELDGYSPAIPAKAGTGGGNLPLVLVRMEDAPCVTVREAGTSTTRR